MTDQIKIGDTVTWVEFKGRRHEIELVGKVLSKIDEDGGYDVEYLRPALAWVSEDKITKVEK